MGNEQGLTTFKKTVLECTLYNDLNIDLSDYNEEEIEYLKRAIRMPYSIINMRISEYENSYSHISLFVKKLQEEFNVEDEKDVIVRIKEVKEINEHPEYYMPKGNVYNKLVRDNIPDVIKANGEEPFTRVLTDEEYWKYLLEKDQEKLREVEAAESLEERKKELGDKLEIIRAMAEFSGYSLDDILEEADKKKQKNFGFEKRILLEKVIK